MIPLGRAERFQDQREVWIEEAHKRWNQALKYRQSEVETQQIPLQLARLGRSHR